MTSTLLICLILPTAVVWLSNLDCYFFSCKPLYEARSDITSIEENALCKGEGQLIGPHPYSMTSSASQVFPGILRQDCKAHATLFAAPVPTFPLLAFAETIAKLQGSVAEEEGELLKKSPPCVNESQKKLANIGGG